MRLAAVYLPQDVLRHLFGEKHIGLTLNFGGKYTYEFNEKGESIQLQKLSKNDNFVNEFWGKNISLISAIVGRNGIGKTSILRALHTEGDKRKKNALYLFEGPQESFYYYNELETKIVNSDFEVKEINSNALSSVKHYYTPIVDSEQFSALSQLGIVSTGEENLDQLYLKQLLQDVILLNDPVKNTLKKVYPDFPEYKELEIKATQHRKFDFKNIYASANLGSQDRITILKTYIESDLGDLEDGNWKGLIGQSFVKENILERYINIINNSGLNSLFDKVWALEEYSNKDENQNIHDNKNFIKDFEITLFSYLIVDATFPRTPFQGTSEFQNILDQDSFQERFDAFFDLYMVSIYGKVRDNITNKLDRVSILDYDQIKEIINEDRNKKFTQSGFKSSDAVKLMLRYLERFKAFYDLYNLLENIISENKFEIREDSIIYRLEEHNQKDFYSLIKSYNKVLSETNNFVYRLDLLSIRSTYSLSSGEKALLNFFSRINNKIDRLKSSNHPIFNYYLLLLDEPELGYHPVWKRKFIDAITKSIPILFGKLEPNRNLFDKDSSEFRNLKTQIIFTTHDPLTLSDIPQNSIVYLDRKEDGITFTNTDKVPSFGANVHDLLAHSFFLEDGFMGEFAQDMITDLINYLTFDEEKPVSGENLAPLKEWSDEKAEKIINIIDEPLIKERVQYLYNKKVLYPDKELLRLEIKKLSNQLERLDNEENKNN